MEEQRTAERYGWIFEKWHDWKGVAWYSYDEERQGRMEEENILHWPQLTWEKSKNMMIIWIYMLKCKPLAVPCKAQNLVLKHYFTIPTYYVMLAESKLFERNVPLNFTVHWRLNILFLHYYLYQMTSIKIFNTNKERGNEKLLCSIQRDLKETPTKWIINKHCTLLFKVMQEILLDRYSWTLSSFQR